MSDFDTLSLIAAFAALILTLWQGFATRRHNRLSVVPYLSCQTHLGGSTGRFGVAFSNSGLGPARITKFDIFVGEKRMEGLDNGREAAIEDLGLKDFGHAYDLFVRGIALPANSAFWVLSVPVSDEAWKQKPKIDEAFKRLFVQIEYESFYGDVQRLDTRVPRGKEKRKAASAALST
jgi:hypothetical protein